MEYWNIEMPHVCYDYYLPIDNCWCPIRYQYSSIYLIIETNYSEISRIGDKDGGISMLYK